MVETYARYDFIAERAEGMYLYDEKGVAYLDFYGGVAVNTPGNRNPKVVAAVKDQLDDIMHTFNYPYTIPQALLAKKICDTIGMDKIFFQNSGTEANECMIKMARKYGVEKYGPEHYHIVTAINGFHGRTYGALSATGQPDNACQLGFKPMLPGFSYAEYNNLEDFKSKVTDNTIAIMIEPVQGEGGYVVPPREWVQYVREICDKYGIMLIFDEVQTGFGRTGNMFAWQTHGVKPDIMSCAKGIANGLPLSAVVGKAEIMDKWTAGAHGGTFGANPVSCAAALATIDALEGGAIENGRRMGEYFIGELKKLQAKYPVIGDVRGLGLMIGMEMVYPDGSPSREMTARIVSLALEHDLYLLSCGCDKNVVRFIAPLTVSKEEIDTALSVLGEVFDQIADEA